MKRLGLVAIPLALLAALVISGCGKTPGNGTKGPGTAPDTVEMASTTFVNTTLTVTAGSTVHFTDPASTGGTHVLCIGNNQTCNKGAPGPSKFADPGITVNPGDPTLDVVFPTAGTYEITCTVHQNMNVTITVQ